MAEIPNMRSLEDKRRLTVISVVIVSETPPNSLHRGMLMLLATASINAISTPALTFNSIDDTQ